MNALNIAGLWENDTQRGPLTKLRRLCSKYMQADIFWLYHDNHRQFNKLLNFLCDNLRKASHPDPR